MLEQSEVALSFTNYISHKIKIKNTSIAHGVNFKLHQSQLCLSPKIDREFGVFCNLPTQVHLYYRIDSHWDFLAFCVACLEKNSLFQSWILRLANRLIFYPNIKISMRMKRSLNKEKEKRVVNLTKAMASSQSDNPTSKFKASLYLVFC